MQPLECATMRSIARCVLPVFVGPRTALIALRCTRPRWQSAPQRATTRPVLCSARRKLDSHGRKLRLPLLCFAKQSGQTRTNQAVRAR